ncbi:MAG: hypothetical protein JSV03_09565 [Planctomycetota bacterium]|nr:MAG: hypothetical protein JSV03_09565 [Planctomycetota bacterium]
MVDVSGLYRLTGRVLVGVLILALPVLSAEREIDRSRYMSPAELKAGMKGFGKTVMSGSRIETFQLEIIGIMGSAFYPKQDVILIRCSGLNLEYSGIVGGMSGSPCYVWDESGEPKMIGALAYGWMFNKDPICGVQPITQMLDIPEVRKPKPKQQNPTHKGASSAVGPQSRPASGKGVSLGRVIASAWSKPIKNTSRFCIFNDEIETFGARKEESSLRDDQLQPLRVPLMISAGAARTIDYLRGHLEKFGFDLVVSGSARGASAGEFDAVKLEPGSVLCVTLMTGDMIIQGLGTCTEVIGDRILAFGHKLERRGSVEWPMATGIVHTVIPSVMRSSKVGAAVKTVGTLYGDENTGVFGIRGREPTTIPLEVVVKDIRGRRTYQYEVVHDEDFTAFIIGGGVVNSILAHSDLPKEHTLRYGIESEFKDLGSFKTGNMTSGDDVYALSMDVMMPILSMLDAPFARARMVRARVEVTVQEGARSAKMDQVTLPKTIYKPGEAVTAHVRWFHYRQKPVYTYAKYSLRLPDDLPDGEYELSIGSATSHLMALRSEKPHLFYAENLPQVLEALNRIGSFAENKVYMRLKLPVSGLAIKHTEMPELPSFQRQILSESKRLDVRKFTEALVVTHDTDYAVSGAHSFKLEVKRRADQ